MKTRTTLQYKRRWPLVGSLALVAGLFTASNLIAQVTIAEWTFESLPTMSYKPGAGVATTNFPAEIGQGMASGFHSGDSTYSSPVGNGSAKSLSSNTWTNDPGDYYQFEVSTVERENISISFDQMGSNTGPGDYYLAYSTDGVNFTQFGDTYRIANDSWSGSGERKAGSYHSFDLSSVTAINNAPTVYFRVVCASSTSINNGTTASGGTGRIDNVAITSAVAGPPVIVSDPGSTNIYFGDSVKLSVQAGGTPPLNFQWYHPDLTTPLVDGGSGYGQGTIAGATSATLTLGFVDTAQAGNYWVVVENSIGAITSQVAVLTVDTRPTNVVNIAYLHTLQDANFALTDRTNVYQVRGVVTTSANLVSGTSVNSYYVQDETGGINIFHRGGFPIDLPTEGDEVRVTGTLDQFNGSLELVPVANNPVHEMEVLSNGNELPEPMPFNFTTIDPALIESTYEGRLVIISNVFLAGVDTSIILSGGTIYATNLTGQVFPLYNPAPAIDPQGWPIPEFATSVRGVLAQVDSTSPYNSGYDLFLLKYADIEIGTPPVGPVAEPLQISVSDNEVVLTWNSPQFRLEAAPDLSSGFTDVPGATSPYHYPVSGGQRFFRLAYP